MTDDEMPEVPEGRDFLSLIRDQESRCGSRFDDWISAAGAKAPETFEALGTAMSYLDRIASCWWGCEGGNHSSERLVGRATSNARAALQLLRTGYYDEALGLVRQIGEAANLVALFVQRDDLYAQWQSATDKARRNRFGPGAVRNLLDKHPLPMPMEQDVYGLLSGRAVHPTPAAVPQGHNVLGVPTMGAYFQEAGALVAMNELAGRIGYLLWLATILTSPRTDRLPLRNAALRLVESVGGANLSTIDDYFNSIRAEGSD